LAARGGARRGPATADFCVAHADGLGDGVSVDCHTGSPAGRRHDGIDRGRTGAARPR